MARPVPNYPELQSAPALCKDKAAPYIRIGPVEVRYAYEGIDKVGIPLHGIVSADDATDLFEMFSPLEVTLEDGGEGTLGWDTKVEDDFLGDLREEAQKLIEEADKYTGDIANTAKALAEESVDYLEQIDEIYNSYHEDITYRIEQGDTILHVPFPLNVHEDDMYLENEFGSGWKAIRIQSRINVVAAWDRALSLLWCAHVALAQLMAMEANKEFEIGGLAQGPGTKPPVGPGTGLGLATGTGPEPDPGPGLAPGTGAPPPDYPGEDEDEPEAPDDTGDGVLEPETPVAAKAAGGVGIFLAIGAAALLLLRK